MAFTIESATHGWNGDGVVALSDKIHTEVIGKAIQDLAFKFDTLTTAVDEIWKGNSAEQFKENMGTDVQKIINALKQTEEQLHTELMNTVDAMQQVDNNLVKPRSE